jgi:hypothetical protein|tara:strand:- start:383 stop:667 length:285 start_codon:yes stop_codon:yes gene_type:complete
MANKVTHPKIKDEKANIKKILKFEYPNIFKVKRSFVFLKLKRNHILEIKIIKGNNLIIMFGTYNAVSVIGIKIDVFEFLKNSISSNKFRIMPKQ